MKKMRMIAVAGVILMLGLVPATPGHAVGEIYGGHHCEADGHGNEVCGIGLFTRTPIPTTNDDTVTFTCISVTRNGTGVANRVAPDSCELRQGPEDVDIELWDVKDYVAGGIGSPGPTAEIGKQSPPISIGGGLFGVCWEVGAIFVDGRDLTAGGCGFHLIQEEEIEAFLLP